MHDRRWRLIHGDDFADERSREIELMLTAIARAIAVGRLPPDDAFAWATDRRVEVKAPIG